MQLELLGMLEAGDAALAGTYAVASILLGVAAVVIAGRFVRRSRPAT